MAVVGVLYALNRFCLAPGAPGALHRLLAWYFADFLAGALMLCFLNACLAAAKRPPVRRFPAASAFLLSCGLFWEVGTPLYLPRPVGDPRDVLAVWLGGMGMWLLLDRKSA